MSKLTTLSTQRSCPPVYVNNSKNGDQRIVSLNVGGQEYSTLLSTLTKQPNSWLAKIFYPLQNSVDFSLSVSLPKKSVVDLPKDSENRYFIDRDGYLFQFVLDFLRTDHVFLPENFDEVNRLKSEFEFYKLTFNEAGTESKNLQINKSMAMSSWSEKTRAINVGYQGTFAFGRDGVVDVKFRRLYRILIAGHASLCRWVFEETLNDNRDPERCSEDRYSSRFFLKHNNLELAFDMLYAKGFDLVGCCGTSTHGGTGDAKPSHHSEESRWQHYNEFIFARRSHPFLSLL